MSFQVLRYSWYLQYQVPTWRSSRFPKSLWTPSKSSIFDWDFPWNKPSNWGIPSLIGSDPNEGKSSWRELVGSRKVQQKNGGFTKSVVVFLRLNQQQLVSRCLSHSLTMIAADMEPVRTALMSASNIEHFCCFNLFLMVKTTCRVNDYIYIHYNELNMFKA